MKIDFHDEVNLDKVQLSQIVSPHCPGELCTPSTKTTTLIYHDKSQDSQGIIWLDCTVSPPQQTNAMRLPHLSPIHELTYTENLLVATDGLQNSRLRLEFTGESKWYIERNMNPKTLSADERGRLFVLDSGNTSIEVFSTDGSYNVRLIKAGDQGLGVPMQIRWCDTTRSFDRCAL